LALLSYALFLFLSLGIRSIGMVTRDALLFWLGDLALVAHLIFTGLIFVIGPIANPRFVILLHSLRSTQGRDDPIQRIIVVVIGVAITLLAALVFINQLAQALAGCPALGCGVDVH
jgi:hypothetical protein